MLNAVMLRVGRPITLLTFTVAKSFIAPGRAAIKSHYKYSVFPLIYSVFNFFLSTLFRLENNASQQQQQQQQKNIVSLIQQSKMEI
jgi:hypothetical protein